MFRMFSHGMSWHVMVLAPIGSCDVMGNSPEFDDFAECDEFNRHLPSVQSCEIREACDVYSPPPLFDALGR